MIADNTITSPQIHRRYQFKTKDNYLDLSERDLLHWVHNFRQTEARRGRTITLITVRLHSAIRIQCATPPNIIIERNDRTPPGYLDLRETAEQLTLFPVARRRLKRVN